MYETLTRIMIGTSPQSLTTDRTPAPCSPNSQQTLTVMRPRYEVKRSLAWTEVGFGLLFSYLSTNLRRKHSPLASCLVFFRNHGSTDGNLLDPYLVTVSIYTQRCNGPRTSQAVSPSRLATLFANAAVPVEDDALADVVQAGRKQPFAVRIAGGEPGVIEEGIE
jgi:hypothetical protein